jgi:predicted ATP-dependent Lon-type protease
MKGKVMKNDTVNSSIAKEAITYAFAHCEAKLSEIARNLEQSEQELREWVGILLLTKGTGTFDSLSSLRGHSTKVHKTVRKMEMVGDTH